MGGLLWAVPLLPLAGFLVNGLAGRRLGERAAAAVGCAAVGGSFLVAAFLVLRAPALVAPAFTWFTIGDTAVRMSLALDPLGAVMLLVVTGVGTLIHIYSIGYMRGDDGFARYFAYLNLFMFSMLVLVLADNLALMFVGWEGVGLCSYLLIGFWYKEGARSDAGTKAFVVNRIGDLGFLLGMFVLFGAFGTLDFAAMMKEAGPKAGMTAACLLLFLGACGKSAQIPLYVWLPDAMAGPTPVSALIHAATMVTAGVYMIARLHFLFAVEPLAMAVIGFVGALTALSAAVMAIPENNIKKVLAYSTISQLAFMFCGVASGAFESGIFHVVTHAFFKALLFLGAGAVIHALHNEEDMRKMGGLAKKMRWTAVLMGAGVLAIAGFPGLSGFFSKELILGGVLHAAHTGEEWYALLWWGIFAALAVSAALTAFYMTRLFILTFLGDSRADARTLEHAHDPPASMALTLWVLAGLSVGGGVLQWIGVVPALHRQFASVPHAFDWSVFGLSFAAFAAGTAMAWALYVPFRRSLDAILETAPGRAVHRFVSNKFYVDQAYEFLFVLPLRLTAFLTWLVVDRWIIDGILVHGWDRLAGAAGRQGGRLQSGLVNASLAVFALGAVIVLSMIVLSES